MSDKEKNITQKGDDFILKNENEQLTENHELQDYIEAVNILAAKKSDLTFSNSSPKHASIVLTTMIAYAKEEFCIFDDNLTGDIADEYEKFYPTLIDFVNKGKKLKIVVEKCEAKDSRIYIELEKLWKKHPTTVLVKKSTNEFLNSVKKLSSNSSVQVNFAVSDNNAFRIEEESTRRAMCSFNNRFYTSKLKKAFDKEFNNCPNIFKNS